MKVYKLTTDKGYRLPEEIHQTNGSIVFVENSKQQTITLTTSIEECKFGWEVWEEDEWGDMVDYGTQLEDYSNFCEHCQAELQ